MFAGKLKKYDLSKFIRGEPLYSFIAYCLLLHMHVFSLCYVTVAMQIRELKLKLKNHYDE